MSIDMQNRGLGEDTAFKDFVNNFKYRNPFEAQSMAHIAYSDEWERLDYEQSQQIADQLGEWGL